MWLFVVLLYYLHQFVNFTNTQGSYSQLNPNDYYYYETLRCPEHWVQYQQSCYRFVKSPLRSYSDSQKICRTFGDYNNPIGGYENTDSNYGSPPERYADSDLLSVNTFDEHGFIVNELNRHDQQHHRWYIGAHLDEIGIWQNTDGTHIQDMENAFFQGRYGDNYLVYNYSKRIAHWGFQPVRGDEPLMFICEANIFVVQKLVENERTFTYGIEVDDPKEIPRGPYFIKQPHDVTFDVSRDTILKQVELSCLAGGYPTPTYEWFKEDYEFERLHAKAIDPLLDPDYTISGGILIIMNPDEKKDRANYHCKATNIYGTIISESVPLYFGYIYEFIHKRADEQGDNNWGKVIYCDPPKFFGKINYYWSRDYFPNLVEEDKRVFVSRDGGLYFAALETIDRGSYSCSVHADYSDTGKTGPFFKVQVNPHSNYEQLKFANSFPKIFENPPIAGEEVKLECMAFGYPIPSYNWTRVNEPMPRNARFESYNRVLLIENVKVEDQGEYMCTIFNDKASLQKSVRLNVQAEPNFTIPLRDKHVDIRSDLIWVCEAFGIPEVNYTWWRNGRQLVMGFLEPEDVGRIIIQDNVMKMYRVVDRDAGMYQCRASNTLKTKYSSAQLRILSFKPSFKKQPLEIESYAAEQGNVTINCNPEAAPKPQFTWRKEGHVIDSGGRLRILVNGSLHISYVSRNDEGIYTCSARNELGLDESRGRLVVLRGPHFIETLRHIIETTVSDHFHLRCEASIDQYTVLDISYIWKHNGMLIRDLDILNSNNRIKINGGYLMVLNTTFPDAGEYECLVKTAVGDISSKSIVVVNGPPGPPGGLMIKKLKKSKVVLTWTDGASHGRPILSYTISGRTNWNMTWVNLTHGVHANDTDDRYSNSNRKEADVDIALTPWSTYEFRVSATNEIGMGVPSAPSPRQATPPDVPYVAPANVRGGGGKRGDLTILWTPLRPDQQNGPGIHYKIFFKQKDQDVEFQHLVLKNKGNIGKAVIHIKPEYFYRQYIVRVQSFNDIGEGAISNEVVVYSAEDMPLVIPQEVKAEPYNSTALNVSWKAVDESLDVMRGKLLGHRIKYWKGNREDESVYYLSRSTKPWALIVGLSADTYYWVKVMVYNGAGEGGQSEKVRQRTYKNAPQSAPLSVHVFGIDPSTIRVKWRYVYTSDNEEPLKGYKIRIWEKDQDMSTANDTYVPLHNALEAYITDLSPGKTYMLRILAYSNGGDGRMSSPILNFRMGDPETFRSKSSQLKINLFITFTLLASTLVLKQHAFNLFL